MPFNLIHYLVVIGVFNNRNLVTKKNNFCYTESNSVGINLLLISVINVMVLLLSCFMSVALAIKKTRVSKWFYYLFQKSKQFLPIELIDFKYLNECISFKLRIGGKVCTFLSLYRSLSQNREEFETFLDNLELHFDNTVNKNSYLVVLIINRTLSIPTTARMLQDQKLRF